MKKCIRYIPIVLLLLLALSVCLTACGGKEPADTTEASTLPLTEGEHETTATSTEETEFDSGAETTIPSATEPDATTDPETSEDATTIAPETNTEPETEDPRDTPKTDAYDMTSAVVLPPYAYDALAGDRNNTGILSTSRDVWADTWSGSDELLRLMPEASATPTPSARQVGIFYFLWRDADQSKLSSIPASDHYAAYMEGGIDKLWEVMQEGGEGHPHYWAQPYFGYYSSNDEWVLRKHAYMFADAGVDFVFFDTTNNNPHTVSHKALMKVWEEVRQEGYEVPKICFLCGDFDGEFHEIYNSIYKQGLYEDLWFYWNGKPLIMTSGVTINFTAEENEFFTRRLSWADTSQPWYGTRRGRGCWPWSDSHRAGYGRDEDGNIEQLVVMCGGGGQVGRSYARGRYPRYEGNWDLGYAIMEASGQGLMFSQMFDYAIDRMPPLIMITGWNEWIAGRWSGAGAGAGATGLTFANAYQVSNDPTKKENSYFVDEFNMEFSRDIEPMKGGFGDNYYYQMAEYIRLYKGSRAVESAFGQWAIDLDGSLGQWYAVGPEYRDYQGDITDRLSPGHVGGAENGMYVNFSGRNDLVTAKVSSDSTYLYFYVECAEAITAPEGERWMNLFINADSNAETGWYGYDFMINRTQSGTTVSVERFADGKEWRLTSVGSAEYRLTDRVLVIKVEKALIGFEGQMDFKWADNSVPTCDIMEFLDQGDAAPNGRYTYRYVSAGADDEDATKLPECLTQDMIVLKSNSYHAFVGGQQVRLIEENTKGVLLVSDQDLWLPAAFLESVGISAEGAETVNHYGMAYVHANDLITAAGKTITVDRCGLVIIADQAIEDVNVRTTLYRALT